MELDKSMGHFRLSQKDKEVAFWSKKYDSALKNLLIIPIQMKPHFLKMQMRKNKKQK